jgi:hypothetical protein
MTYLLHEVHYVIAPTRNASRYKKNHIITLLETDSLEEIAKVVASKEIVATVDHFVYVKDDTVLGYHGLSKEELDEYFDFRRKYKKEKEKA